MKRTVSIMVVLCLFISGCATTHRMALYDEGADGLLLVKQMVTDVHGRPVPGEYLKKRPTKVGKQYTAVLMHKGRPLRSFDIRIKKAEKPDFAKPFVLLGSYTAAGFLGGVWFGAQLFLYCPPPDSCDSDCDDDELDGGDLFVGSVIVGTAIGLTVGVITGVSDMAKEIHLLTLKSDETLLTYSEYEYDRRHRLSVVRQHTADGLYYDHIVTTKYQYEGADDAPVSSETSSDYVFTGDSSDI